MSETKSAQIEGTPLPSTGHEEGQMCVRILITDANGQLGRVLMTLLPQAGFEPTDVDLSEMDISDTAATFSQDWSGYDIIVNATAWTNVDGAETPERHHLSWRVNTVDPVNLARVAVRHGLTPVHLPTECTSDRAMALHVEEETPSPPGVYGQSRTAGDAAVSVCPQHYPVRTSWVVGDDKNFVKAMLSLAERGITPSAMAGQTRRLTFASDLTAGIIHLLTVGTEFGTYNLSDDRPIVSWANVAKQVYERVGHGPDEVTAVTTEKHYASQRGIALRPLDSALDLAKIKATGFTPADSTKRPEAYLQDLPQVETDRFTLPHPRFSSEISMGHKLTKYLQLPIMSRMGTGTALSRRPMVVGGLLLILMLLTGLGWVVSSPMKSSPDDNCHLGSIWCPRSAGKSCQISVVDGDSVVRALITVAGESMGCYILQSDRLAGCVFGYDDSHMVRSRRFNNGVYPVDHYHFHHPFVGEDVQISVLVV